LSRHIFDSEEQIPGYQACLGPTSVDSVCFRLQHSNKSPVNDQRAEPVFTWVLDKVVPEEQRILRSLAIGSSIRQRIADSER
jgi:hypothetical protein